MAWYSEKSILKKSDGNKTWWMNDYSPSDKVPISGIYRCLGCNREIASNENDSFPPQNHHQHTKEQGEIRWKLNVRTESDKD
jgi:hypothetical protein